jgi:hypothetical protein
MRNGGLEGIGIGIGKRGQQHDYKVDKKEAACGHYQMATGGGVGE